jgi:phosphoglycolate phosphatase-like HAD superfamily hydrolase
MWTGWAEDLATRLEAAVRRPIREPLFEMLGYDPEHHRADAHGGLIATPMARIREMTSMVLVRSGVEPSLADAALADAWHAPDPVTLAHPLGDLDGLFRAIHASGRRTAIVTSDDREPTHRTLAALRLGSLVDAVVCADDGPRVKPQPDAVIHVCRELGTGPHRTAVVGDSPADIAMGRAAGVKLVIGVRTGLGTDQDLGDADVLVDSVAVLRAAI